MNLEYHIRLLVAALFLTTVLYFTWPAIKAGFLQLKKQFWDD